jgi:glucose-6-phosphate isomerase
MKNLPRYQSWQALENHYNDVKDVHLRELFAEDPERGDKLKIEAVGLYFDYSNIA